MLKVTILEFILRFIPESFLIIITAYVFAKKKPESGSVFISSVILSVSVYLIRLLPIQFGVHTILAGTVAVFLLVHVNKIPVKLSVFSIFTVIIIEGVCEIANMIFIKYVMNVNVQVILSNPTEKIIWLAPSLFIAALTIYTISIWINMKKIK